MRLERNIALADLATARKKIASLEAALAGQTPPLPACEVCGHSSHADDLCMTVEGSIEADYGGTGDNVQTVPEFCLCDGSDFDLR